MPDTGGHRRRRVIVLITGLFAITLWQYVFFRHGYPDAALANSYRLTASNGIAAWQPEFVYFLYYLNLYPVASIADVPRENSVGGARRLIAEEGRSLVMDRYWTTRYGDLAKTYLYLPHVWIKGNPVKPRMLHANALGFTVALLVLFAAFWHVGETALGVLLVVLMGSNPFQVNEVYATNNLFGWPITITLLMLALHVPLMRNREQRTAGVLLLAVASGLLLGTLRQVRTEPTLVLIAVAGVYLTATRLRWWLRLVLVVLLGGTFLATSAGWTAYFETKFREAYRVVKTAGGHVYDGPRHPHHFFWHALFCGLGDFDRKYGYRWSDITAFSYAWAILQQRDHYEPAGYPPLAADPFDVFTFGSYWDRGRQYARTPYEIPEYAEIVRNKMLGDVVHDPLWYASILARRLVRLLAESTPPSLALGNGRFLSLPGRATWGYLAALAALVLLWKREGFGLKLIAFTAPLAGTALLVYSGGGTPLYSVGHLVTLAVATAATLRAWKGFPPLNVQVSAVKDALAVLIRRAVSARSLVAFVAAGFLLLVAGAIARRLVPPASAAIRYEGAPALAVLRFENQTSDEGLAWIGDAVGELLAASMRDSGLRVLDADVVANLDASLVWWGPYGVPSVNDAVAVNVVADRSGADRLLTGRLQSSPRDLRVCATAFSAKTRRGLGPERCEPITDQDVLSGSRRLAATLLSVLGVEGQAVPPAARDMGSAVAFRLFTEARRAVRRQMWGEAHRLLTDTLRQDAGFLPARLLQARLRAQWQPLDRDVLLALTGRSDTSAALTALRAAFAEHPDSTEARLDLARTLVALEFFDEAEAVLGPLLRRPGTPAEAFGLSAASASSRGDLAHGYQVLLEYQRRSWREPRGVSLLAEHLLRWQDLGAASLALENAEKDREQRGESRFTLDDLARGWRIHALKGEWRQAEQLAYRMTGLDDPRAAGTGYLYVATGNLFQGRSRLADAFAEEAAFRLSQQHLDPTPAFRLAAEVKLDRGDAQGALDLLGAGTGTTDPTLARLETMALARLGRGAEAEAVRRRLAASLAQVPGPRAKRTLLQLDGELALLRKQTFAAVQAFSQAERMLSPRGFCGDHVPIWYGLARAHLATNNRQQAEAWFRRVADASFERLCWPIPYAQSLAHLGRIQAADKRIPEAAESFERFLALWGNADLADLERVNASAFQQAHSPAIATGSND